MKFALVKKYESVIFVVLMLISQNIFGQGFICAIGGGNTSSYWADQPFSWIVEKSDSGKVIILSVESSTSLIPYFENLGAVDAINLVISSSTIADNQSTYDEIKSASAIYIVGGNQKNYVQNWKGTKTEDAINEVFQEGGVISGSSAGAAILGKIAFSAWNGSAMPKQSLLNPFYSKITLEDDFLNLIDDVIFDTHFIERGRFGRLIPFLINYNSAHSVNILGVGLDDKTAICIDNNGIGKVFGTGAISIYEFDDQSNLTVDGSFYEVENLKCDMLVENWEYDFVNREINYIPSSAVEIDTAREWKNLKTNVTLTGRDEISANISLSLPQFLNEDNSLSVVILKDSTTVSGELENYLTDNSYNFNLIETSASSLNNFDNSQFVNEATCFIILGKPEFFSTIADSSTPCGNSFNQKVESGTPIYFMGNAGKSISDQFVSNVDEDPLASYYGEMNLSDGIGIFGEVSVQPRIFESEDYYENRTSALTWGMMRNRNRIGIYIDNNDYIKINSVEKSISSHGSMPILILDGRYSTFVDSSKYIIPGGSSLRRVAGMNNIRFSVSRINKKYFYESGYLSSLTDIKNESFITSDFKLYNNYPNPFNGITNIRFYLPKSADVNLSVYNLIGQLVSIIANESFTAGLHSVEFNTKGISSGVYFYRLISEKNSVTKKMLFLK